MDYQAALTAIKNDKISLRAAEGAFGVPKSTLSFYLGEKLLNLDLHLS